MTLAPRRDAPVICAGCGRQVQRQSRQQRFCSKRCRQKGHYVEKVARGDFSGCTPALSTHPHQNGNEFNGLWGAKLVSSPSILAPSRILDVEIWGSRNWRETVSSGGVAIEVSRVRPRSLVSP